MYSAALSIKGNARVCVLMEPLFAIPITLYTGFMTLYMLELGMTRSQVGMVTSLGLAIHIFFALISTYVTDKLGRRYTSLIFDIIGWGVAQLVWAFALDIRFFIVAAVFNAFFRIVANSWMCLLLDDSAPDTRVNIFNFLQIANIFAGFFAPIGALLVNRMSLVPAMRVMILFSAVIMTLTFIVRHFFLTETSVGRQKMQEMKGVGISSTFKTYVLVAKRIFKDKLLMIAVLLRSLNFIQLTIRGTFLAVLVTERLGFSAETMALFHTLNAVVLLCVMMFITPLLSIFTNRWPISLGIWLHIAATVVLLLSPPENISLLIIGAILIAAGTAIATPRIDAFAANAVDNDDRSVANAVMAVILLLLSTPFGLIAGILSEADPRLPFLLTLTLFLLCLLLLRIASHSEKRRVKSH